MLVFLFYNAHEQRLRCFWRLLLHAGLFLLAVLLVGIIAVLAGPSALSDWLERLSDPVLMILTVLVAAWVLDRRRWPALGFWGGRHFWQELTLGLGLGSGLTGLLILAAYVLGWTTGDAGVPATNPTGVEWLRWCGILLLYVIVGLGEEVLFRGYWLRNMAEGLDGWLRPVTAIWTAVTITSLLFASAHLLNEHVSLLAWFNTVLAGLGLALTVAITGRLAIAMGFHIAWNAVQSVVFGLPVSGSPADVSIWTFTLSGPTWWTAGCIRSGERPARHVWLSGADRRGGRVGKTAPRKRTAKRRLGALRWCGV